MVEDELSVRASYLPPSLQIARMMIAMNRRMIGYEALEYVETHDYDEVSSTYPEVKIAADLVKSIIDKYCMPEGNPIDDDMYYYNRGEGVKEYFSSTLSKIVDMDIFFTLAGGLGDDYWVEGEGNSLIWDMLREYREGFLQWYVKDFSSSSPYTAQLLQESPSVWLATLLPLELLAEDELAMIVAPLNQVLSHLTVSFGTYDDYFGTYLLGHELLDYAATQCKATLSTRNVKTEEDVVGYLKNISEEYPILKNGNKDFIATLKKVLRDDKEWYSAVNACATYLKSYYDGCAKK